MDLAYYEIENLHKWFDILPEEKHLAVVVQIHARFDANVLDILGRELPAHVTMNLLQDVRRLLLDDLHSYAAAAGYNPAIMMPRDSKSELHPLLRGVGSPIVELCQALAELLRAWDKAKVIGFACQDPAGAAPVIHSLAAVRERFKCIASISSS